MTILRKVKKFFIKLWRFICKPWNAYVQWVAKGFDGK